MSVAQRIDARPRPPDAALTDDDPRGSGQPGAPAPASPSVDTRAEPDPVGQPPVRTGPATGIDDEADGWLVGRAVHGDVQAFEVLVRRHQQRVYRIAYRITGNRADAEDVAQDVWVRVLGALASFTGASGFTTWLHRVTVNSSLSAVRGRTRRTDHLTGGEPDTERSGTTPGAGDESETRARTGAVQDAIAALDPDLRAVLVLRHFEDLSYAQLCEVLDLPEPTVRGRLARARARLAAALEEWQ